MTEPTDDTLRDWLLGQLAPADAEALEERLIEDEAFATRLRDVENDLLDDLARGALAGDERARAAAYFAATPNDRARLRIARALAAVKAAAAASHAPSHARRPRRRWAGAALALASVAAIAVIGVELRSRFATAPVAFTITLTDGQQRGAASIELAVPKDASEVRLQAEVDGDAGAHYRLAIDDAFAASGLPVRTAGAYRFVETTVPAAALAAGSHRVRVVAETGAPSEASWTLTTRSE
jgi:anti-sigma-K factor RskA